MPSFPPAPVQAHAHGAARRAVSAMPTGRVHHHGGSGGHGSHMTTNSDGGHNIDISSSGPGFSYKYHSERTVENSE